MLRIVTSSLGEGNGVAARPAADVQDLGLRLEQVIFKCPHGRRKLGARVQKALPLIPKV